MTTRHDFSGKKVIVTGASGFLGSHLSNSLSLLGADVFGVSRSIPSAASSPIRWRQGDVTNIEFVRSLFSSIQPDLVFHLCSYGVGSPDPKNLLPTVQNDFLTTINVLAAATEDNSGKLILASSLEEPKPSDSNMIPSSPYAAAKWAGSVYAQMCHLLYQTRVVMVRPYMTYGPGQPKHKVLPYVIMSLLKGEVPKLSSGDRLVDWIYIDDVIDGMLRAAVSEGIEGDTIDLGSGQLVSIKEVVRQIVQLVGNGIEPLFSENAKRPQERIRAADVQSAIEKIQWSPTVGLADGLKKTVEWYRRSLDTRR